MMLDQLTLFDLPTQPDLPSASNDEQLKSIEAQLGLIPHSLLCDLMFHIATIRNWNQRVSSARQTDSKFAGNGRYTWEATNGLQQTFDFEFARIQRFKELARKNGLDADQILESLGLQEPIQLSPEERDDPPPSLPPPKILTRSQELRIDYWNGWISFYTRLMTKSLIRSTATIERIKKGELTERELRRWNRGEVMRRESLERLFYLRENAKDKIKEIENE